MMSDVESKNTMPSSNDLFMCMQLSFYIQWCCIIIQYKKPKILHVNRHFTLMLSLSTDTHRNRTRNQPGKDFQAGKWLYFYILSTVQGTLMTRTSRYNWELDQITVSNWIFTSCQPHRVISGRSNSAKSKCTLLIYRNTFWSQVHEANPGW